MVATNQISRFRVLEKEYSPISHLSWDADSQLKERSILSVRNLFTQESTYIQFYRGVTSLLTALYTSVCTNSYSYNKPTSTNAGYSGDLVTVAKLILVGDK